MLPASACARLRELCAALREPEGQGLPPPELPGPAELRLQRLARRQNGLHPEDAVPPGGRAARTGPSRRRGRGVRPAPVPQGAADLNVNITDAPLRDAVRTLVALAGFDGCSVEPPGGLWFYRGARPYPSGELLWDEALVRAYDLSRLLAPHRAAQRRSHCLRGAETDLSRVVEGKRAPPSFITRPRRNSW